MQNRPPALQPLPRRQPRIGFPLPGGLLLSFHDSMVSERRRTTDGHP
ncbi:hypothetical protein [Peterkaempfera sp. SMS 1(5)a]